jgi:hypothetical protein
MSSYNENQRDIIYRYRATENGRRVYNANQKKFSRQYYEKNKEVIIKKRVAYNKYKRECLRLRLILLGESEASRT